MGILPPPAGRLVGPEPSAPEEVAAQVVAAAVWAPSAHNTQPWCFSVRGQEISLHADVSRQLMVADPAGREMMISCGAALFTARLAVRWLGYIPDTRVLPDPARPWLVARVSWQRRADPAEYEQRLFRWVLRRRTHRGGFAPLPLAPGLLAALQRGASRCPGVVCLLTTAYDRPADCRCRAGAATCAADQRRLRGGGGAAQPAARTSVVARLHPRSLERRHVSAGAAPARDGRAGRGQRPAPARKRLVP